MAGLLDVFQKAIEQEEGSGTKGVDDDYKTSQSNRRHQRDKRVTASGACERGQIDLKLQIPGHKRCYNELELAGEIASNVLTGGATGGSKVLSALIEENTRDGTAIDPRISSAVSLALRKGDVRQALVDEATRNPQAVLELVQSIRNLSWEKTGQAQGRHPVLEFTSALASTAQDSLSALERGGSEVLGKAQEIGSKALDGTKSFLNDVKKKLW